MNNLSHYKRLSILTFFSFILVACDSATSTPPEIEPGEVEHVNESLSPEDILKNALTQSPDHYQRDISINITDAFLDPTPEFNIEIDSLIDRSDPGAIESQAEVAVLMHMPEEIAETVGVLGYEQHFEGQLTRVIDELYLSVSRSDVEVFGDEAANQQAKAQINPYQDQAYRASLNEFQSLLRVIYGVNQGFLGGDEEILFNFEEQSDYFYQELGQDIVDTELLTIEKDHGLETIETLSGETVETHHYELALDRMGVLSFTSVLNEKINFKSAITYHLFNFTDYSNEAYDLQVWIGQDDHHIYKLQFTTTDRVESDLIVEITVQNELLDSVSVDAPEDQWNEFGDTFGPFMNEVESQIPYIPREPEEEKVPELLLENGDVMTFQGDEIVIIAPDGQVTPTPDFDPERMDKMIEGLEIEEEAVEEEEFERQSQRELYESVRLPEGEDVLLSEHIESIVGNPETSKLFQIDEICKKNPFQDTCDEVGF